MEFLILFFIIAFIISVIAITGRNFGERKGPDHSLHSGWSSDGADLMSLDPSPITQSQLIYDQAGFESGDRHSPYDSCAPANAEPAYDQPAYDSCAPMDTAPGDFGGGGCSDSGGSFDSGGACSTDSGSGSY
jgi:hypothetical protein